MIESDNLRTASLYINNQLLSRGLLRDGTSIDFADPGRTDGELAQTMGRIMSVVNDLILRRDRDAEHRESLATTLRTQRADSLRQASDLTRLTEKNAEAQRKLSLAEAAEGALRTQLRSAEATIHKLTEDAARTKTLVGQTRAACANEVRKRDRQIDALKKAVGEAGRARGQSRNPAVTTIQVTGDIGCEADRCGGTAPGGTENEGYDLRQETNAFLAELAKGLSEDNEALLALFRRTSGRLREMSGFSDHEGAGGGGIQDQAVGTAVPTTHHASALPSSPAELEDELDAIVEHLRTILTNPSFVPIEEVVIREDEIHRLRDGWEKMEGRWQEAVHLMDGWRRRMAASGRPVNMEELKMGLRLSPIRVRDVAETHHGMQGVPLLQLSVVQEDDEEEEHEEQEEEYLRVEEAESALASSPCPGREGSLHLEPAPPPLPEYYEAAADDSGSDPSDIEEEDDLDELDESEPNVQILQQSVMFGSIDSSPLPPPPQLSPLKEAYSAGNRGVPTTTTARSSKKRQGDFTTIMEENTKDLNAAATSSAPKSTARRQQLPSRQTTRPPRPVPQEEKEHEKEAEQEPLHPVPNALDESSESLDSILLVKVAEPAPLAPPASKATTTQRNVAPNGGGDGGGGNSNGSKPARTRSEGRQPPAAATSATKQRPTRSAGARPTPPQKSRRQQQQPEKKRAEARRARTPVKAGTAAPETSSDMANATSEMPPPPAPQAAPASTTTRNRSPLRGNSSRLPKPRGVNGGLLPAPQQSPLTMATIAAKLAASEREADAARVRAKLKAARLAKQAKLGGHEGGSKGTATADAIVVVVAAPHEGDVDPVKKDAPVNLAAAGTSTVTFPTPREESPEPSVVPPVARAAVAAASIVGGAANDPDPDELGGRAQTEAGSQVLPKQRAKRDKTRATRVASRRRSTLNPWELESLIQGTVPPVEPTPAEAGTAQ